MSAARPSEVARLLGARPAALRLVKESGNAHWWVRDESGDHLVLRRYGAHRSRDAVDFEASVLRALADRGWPVAAPLAPAIEVGGRWWALFPRLPGRRQPWARDDPRHHWRGELLAALHADMKALTKVGQRDGFHRTTEETELTPEHAALLARLRRLDPPRAVAFDRHARQIAEGISFLRAAALPATVVHGDFLPWNLHTSGRSLLAILDFDATHIDARAADLAFATWGGRHPAVVDGYSSVAPLREEEETALAVLWRARWLGWGWHLLARTRDRVEPELDAVLEKLARPWGA